MITPNFPQTLLKTIIVLWIELALDLGVMMIFGFIILGGSIAALSGDFRGDDYVILVGFAALIFFMLLWSIFKLIVTLQLRKQKRWAWIAAIIICALNCLSFPYIICGIIGLVGLLDSETKAWFAKR